MIKFTKNLVGKPKKPKKIIPIAESNKEIKFLNTLYIDFMLGRYEKIHPDLDKILEQIKPQPILTIKAGDSKLEVISPLFSLIVEFKGKDINIDYYDNNR